MADVQSDQETITVGTEITPYDVRPSTTQLFRFSAATWNAHRIHYDQEYARSEGYPNVLVQSHLHGCFLSNAVLEWAGDNATLREFRWQNRRLAVAGDHLTVTGTVTAVYDEPGTRVVEVELEEHNQRGELCAPGRAVLALPDDAGDR
ncbi:acyl dehydratase [Amycolatopsis sp. K13G38]|uniref:Acyl dehydratase n=1 Tax=Amycolatopsis acididurans TaxID=2724524 RepID=A0ABX1J9F3_9PSEU|nr:MaoC family dehydratase N-terminal domain-containing protein [Amycolatopsis acididurans]NKQ55006.1 acyl dehydratase [Amycolatopsis acididurans]